MWSEVNEPLSIFPNVMLNSSWNKILNVSLEVNFHKDLSYFTANIEITV